MPVEFERLDWDHYARGASPLQAKKVHHAKIGRDEGQRAGTCVYENTKNPQDRVSTLRDWLASQSSMRDGIQTACNEYIERIVLLNRLIIKI